MPGTIRSMYLEHVLRDVQTDRGSLLHGRLLRWQFDTVTLAHRCRRGASTPSFAVYQRVSAKNIDVKIRFKPVAGKVDQAGGIIVRLITPDDHYVARANALEDNVRFYRVVKGKREQLKGANIKVATNEWHTLELRAEDDRFTVSFDGKQLYTARDDTFSGAGRVGLWTKADSVTYFEHDRDR